MELVPWSKKLDIGNRKPKETPYLQMHKSGEADGLFVKLPFRGTSPE